MSYKKIITAFGLLLIISACSVFEDLGEAKSLVKAKKYEKAIELLNSFKTKRAKGYNAQVHLEYAIEKLKDIKIDKLQRYKEAKEILNESINLDPENLTAKNYYLMLTKTIAYEFPDTI